VGFVIRDATPLDADGVAVLLDSLGYPTTAQAAAGHIERFSEHPESRLLVADSGNGLVGFVATHLVPRMEALARPASAAPPEFTSWGRPPSWIHFTTPRCVNIS
jgi:hypothetical protein